MRLLAEIVIIGALIYLGWNKPFKEQVARASTTIESKLHGTGAKLQKTRGPLRPPLLDRRQLGVHDQRCSKRDGNCDCSACVPLAFQTQPRGSRHYSAIALQVTSPAHSSAAIGRGRARCAAYTASRLVLNSTRSRLAFHLRNIPANHPFRWDFKAFWNSSFTKSGSLA